MAKYQDVYGRAKTVRIGKWRWPPPRDESGNCLPGQPTSFLEFKRLRRQEREERRAAGLQDDSSSDELDDLDDLDDEDEDLVDFPEIQDMDANGTEAGSPKSESVRTRGGDEEPIIRAFEGETRPGSVGKLRISSEMKAKLEQLTMDHSVRSRASSRRRREDELPVAPTPTTPPDDNRKLREERKLALERQLGWQDAASEAHSFRLDNLVKAKIQKMERRSQAPMRDMASSRPPRASDRAGLGPPPPPPQHQQQQQQQSILQQQQLPPRGGSGQSGTSSVAASSSVCMPTTPVVPRHREPRHPMALHPEKLLEGMGSSKAEAIEFEDCAEFLQPVDEAPPPAPVVRARDNLKTRLYPPSSAPYITYTKVEWRIRIRKEVFQPGEQLQEPQALHLVFCQVVADAFGPACIRLREDEAARLRALCDSLGVSPSPESRTRAPVQAQRSVVEAARDLPLYFSRMFPASGGRQLPDVHLVAVAHSGLRLVKRDPPGQLRVLETVRFEDIADVSAARPRTLQLLLRHGGWMTIYSPKAGHIQALVRRFVMEGTQEVPEYVQAVADYVTTESTLLSFREGELIRLIKQRCTGLAKGWLYGVTDTGDSGLFPCEYVAPLSSARPHGPSVSPTSAIGARGDMRSPSEHAPAHNGATNWVEAKDHVDNLEDHAIEQSNGVESHMADGKHSMLQYAMFNFRESLDRYEMLRDQNGSFRGSLKMLEDLKASKKGKDSDWTWKELAQLIKFSKSPIKASLLNLESPELNKLAIDSFLSIMRYMGDYPMSKNQSEVDCVYSILVSCHKIPALRDEVYCQIIKQTTSNKSSKPDSCQRGWRLFSIVAAYFDCSENLKPYLFKFLEAAAYDKRRAYHGTAMVCLQNLRKTFKYGGRKNVPSIEEIAAISAGRNSKRQIYRLPGGTERVINTKSTTVVEDIIDEICGILGVRGSTEMDEFSLYCIVEGDPLTMPLSREEYILDVTTELIKNGHVFYLIFCRSVWFFPLRLDNPLYVELIFNQVAPDYLEGLLLVQPQGRRLPDPMLGDIARIAALLHRAADMQHVPSKDEVKYLLPKPVLASKDVKPPHWVDLVQRNWADMMALTNTEAKAQCLDILQRWPLFGSCFFAVKWIRNENVTSEHILALNREGIHFLDVVTHESVWMYPFSEVISTRKVRAEDGTLYLDMKCGNLMVQKITRIQTDQAHEISRLVRQYINIQQSHQGNQHGGAPQDVTLSRNLK